MLRLTVHTRSSGDVQLEFEHSLLSMSKWEDKTGKAFLANSQKSPSEMLDYYGIMLTSPEQDPDLVIALTPDQQDELWAYVNSTPGPTSFPPKDEEAKKSRDLLTADIIYTQMTMLRIPWETQHWHVNKLLLHIAWVAYKQTPPKKEKKASLLKSWANDNEKARAFFKSNG